MINKKDTIYLVLDEEIKKISKLNYVLDIGTSSRFAKEMNNFKQYFSNNYFALGYNPQDEPGEDKCDMNCDILSLPIKNNSVNAIICLEVIEHVVDPEKAIAEIYRVIKPKGAVILTTPFLLPFHGKGKSIKSFSHSSYPDFWRFTHQGLELLFKRFKQAKIIPFSNTASYYANQIFKFNKIPLLNSKFIQKLIIKIKSTKLGCATHRHFVVAKK